MTRVVGVISLILLWLGFVRPSRSLLKLQLHVNSMDAYIGDVRPQHYSVKSEYKLVFTYALLHITTETPKPLALNITSQQTALTSLLKSWSSSPSPLEKLAIVLPNTRSPRGFGEVYEGDKIELGLLNQPAKESGF